MHKILIIDDSPQDRESLKEILENKFTILEANNGPEAIALLAKETPSLFISDFHMPNMTGIELAEEIRKNGKFASTPIIIFSSEKDKEIRDRGRKLGVKAWVIKPAVKENFLRVVEGVLKNFSNHSVA